MQLTLDGTAASYDQPQGVRVKFLGLGEDPQRAQRSPGRIEDRGSRGRKFVELPQEMLRSDHGRRRPLEDRQSEGICANLFFGNQRRRFDLLPLCQSHHRGVAQPFQNIACAVDQQDG